MQSARQLIKISCLGKKKKLFDEPRRKFLNAHPKHVDGFHPNQSKLSLSNNSLSNASRENISLEKGSLKQCSHA